MLWQVRDLQHENICRMIGLCLSSSDPKSTSEKWDQILFLNEYCSRGSLRDVLLNVHIHLDWPFRLSLISDIVNVTQILFLSPLLLLVTIPSHSFITLTANRKDD